MIQINNFKNFYNILPTKVIAENLNRSRGSISGRASTLGLRKRDMVITEDGKRKICSKCSKELPISEFMYKNKGKMSEGKCCNECRRKDIYHKSIQKKIDEMKEKAGYLSTSEMKKREEEKNSKRFICSICGKELPGYNFTFKNKKSNDIDTRCRKCRSKINTENKYKKIIEGKCW